MAEGYSLVTMKPGFSTARRTTQYALVKATIDQLELVAYLAALLGWGTCITMGKKVPWHIGQVASLVSQDPGNLLQSGFLFTSCAAAVGDIFRWGIFPRAQIERTTLWIRAAHPRWKPRCGYTTTHAAMDKR